MSAKTGRVLLGIAVIAVAIVLLIVLKDDSGDDSSNSGTAASGKVEPGSSKAPKPKIPTIAIENGKPVGGITELTYDEGDRIRFEVDSDVSDEVHIHGYDIMKDVEAGGSVEFDFPATIEGVFEGELEGRGEQILELTVNP